MDDAIVPTYLYTGTSHRGGGVIGLLGLTSTILGANYTPQADPCLSKRPSPRPARALGTQLIEAMPDYNTTPAV